MSKKVLMWFLVIAVLPIMNTVFAETVKVPPGETAQLIVSSIKSLNASIRCWSSKSTFQVSNAKLKDGCYRRKFRIHKAQGDIPPYGYARVEIYDGGAGCTFPAAWFKANFKNTGADEGEIECKVVSGNVGKVTLNVIN